MRTTRYTGWRSDEEHFRYDVASASFVTDAEPASKSSDLAPSPGLGENLSRYLEALVDVTRDFEQRPADQWESGRLLTLYAAATQAAARADAVMQALSSAHELYDRKHGRALLRFTEEANATLCDYCSELERFFGEVINVSEIVVERRWPTATSRVAACIDGIDTGNVAILNATISELGFLQVPEIRRAVDVWLTSYNKPHHFSSINNKILNGTYWCDEPEALDRQYRLASISSKVRSSLELVEACLVVVRRMLRHTEPLIPG